MAFNEIIVFLRYEFFPNMLTFISSFLNNTFSIQLTHTQVVVIAIVLLLMLIFFVLNILKKIVPLIIIAFILLYIFYGDLSFIENILDVLPLK
jgi:hypothetical protein